MVLRNSSPKVKKTITRIVTTRRDKQTGMPPKSVKPPGPKRFLTKEWCESVDAELKAQGLKRADLARMIGVEKPDISRTLNMTHKSSTLVDAICEKLNVAPPEFLDARDAEVTRNLRKLRELWPERFDQHAARIAADLSKPPPRR